MIGVRVDIDCVGDGKAVPAVLELMDSYGVRASFFIATGRDECYRNFRRYLNPLRLLSARVLEGYRLEPLLRFLSPMDVQEVEELQMIAGSHHELGLHGYAHFQWMNSLPSKSREEVAGMIDAGCRVFEEAFGFKPACFAAPGFKTTPEMLLALDDFGFRYSSDFHGRRPFYPVINGRRLSTVQLPITLTLEEQGNGLAEEIRRRLGEGYLTLYLHPIDALVFRDEVERVFSMIGERAVPLGELVP